MWKWREKLGRKGRNGSGRKKLMRDYKEEDRDRRKSRGMRWVERKGKIQEEKRESLGEKRSGEI